MEVVEPVNPKAYQIADEYQLGTVQSEYRDNTHLGWLSVMLLLFLGILFLYLAYLNLQPSSPDTTGDLPTWFNSLGHDLQAFAFILLGTLLLIGGMAGIYTRIKDLVQGEMHVYVCSKGFIIARKRITEVVRWEDIEKIQKRFVYSKPHKHKKQGVLDRLPIVSYTIHTKSDTGHTFLEEPGVIIEDGLTAYLLPQALTIYQAEKPLKFDWLTLTIQGIQLNTTPTEETRHIKRSWRWYPIRERIVAWLDRKQALGGTCTTTGEQFLPWSKLTMLWIDESTNTLIICRRNEGQHWAIVPLNHVTNVELCLALIKYVVSNKPKHSLDAIVSSRNDALSGQSTSLEMYQVRNAYQLGTLIETYKTRTTRSGKIFLGITLPFLLLVTGIIISLLVSLLSTFNDPFSLSPLSIALTIGFPLLLLIGEFTPLFFILYTHDTLVTPIRRKIVVYLHTDGIVYCEGRQQQIISWKQIKLVQRQTTKIWKKVHHFYMLQLTNNSTIVLKMIIANVQELGDTVEHEVTKQQFPQFLADYETGKRISFPGLCLTQQYIYNSHEKLPWNYVGEIKVNQEQLIIKERDASEDWLSLPISLFPNLCVLEELLKHIQHEQGLDTQLL